MRKLLICLGILVLAGCVIILFSKPDLPETKYMRFTLSQLSTRLCYAEGILGAEDAALILSHIERELSTWNYDEEKLNALFLDTQKQIKDQDMGLVKDLCNSLLLDAHQEKLQR